MKWRLRFPLELLPLAWTVVMGVTSPSLATAENRVCSLLLNPTGTVDRTSTESIYQLNPDIHSQNHDVILQYAKDKGLPVFEMTLASGGRVPVALLNQKTVQLWSPVLEQTIGINQSLHPENQANHGWIRLSGRVKFDQFKNFPGRLYEGVAPEGVLVDLFSPAHSYPQAINGTGYRWKWLSSEFQRRRPDDPKTYVHIEQAFALSREDQIKVWLYHAVKRSGLVRIQYMFDQHNNDWILSQQRVLQRDEPYNRRKFGEHCNNCRIGATAIDHANEMRGRVGALLNQSVNEVYSQPETHRFLDDAKRRILYRDWRKHEGPELNPEILNDDHFIGLVKSHFREGLSREQQVDALSYLLATNIFEEVVGVKNKYLIEEEVAMGLGNPRVSVIFIYSELRDSPERFYNGDFEYFGANGAGFSTRWPGLNPQKVYGDMLPDGWQQWQPNEPTPE